MSREAHVRFWERVGVRFPCATRPIAAWKAAPRTTPGGQPHYSDLAITTALTLRAVFHLALRQTEGLIGSILQLLSLDLPVPDFSTLSRRAQSLELPTQPRVTGEPIHLLVDSSGLKLSGMAGRETWHQQAAIVAQIAHRLRRGNRPDRRLHPD